MYSVRNNSLAIIPSCKTFRKSLVLCKHTAHLSLKCPIYLSLLHLITSLIFSMHILSLSSAFVFFSLSDPPHIHLTILISALSSFASCSAFTAHVSLPYIIELWTHAPYTFPFNLNATFLLVKITDNSLNFFQPHPTLEIDGRLDPPSPFNISPR